MRITVDIPNLLYRKLTAKAARGKRSMRETILRSIEAGMAPDKKGKRVQVLFPLIRSKSGRKLELDNRKIFELISFP